MGTDIDLGKINGWADLFSWFKDEIKDQIKVSTLAFYDSTTKAFNSSSGYGIAKVIPFPLAEGEEQYYIEAFFFGDVTFTANQKLLVCFTDKNFIKNLSFNVPKETKSLLTHSNTFGVIVGTTGGGGSSSGVTDVKQNGTSVVTDTVANVTVPTSVDGLGGGQLTSALYLAGGDATSGVANIQLDSDGQITAKGTTATLFGRIGGNLYCGHASHPLLLRGTATRPTYNGNNLALYSDLPPTVSGVNDGTNWTSITIGDTTKAIPSGGSGSSGFTTVNWTFASNGTVLSSAQKAVLTSSFTNNTPVFAKIHFTSVNVTYQGFLVFEGENTLSPSAIENVYPWWTLNYRWDGEMEDTYGCRLVMDEDGDITAYVNVAW